MRLALVMEMVVDKDVDVKDDEDVDVEVDCEVFEEVAKYVYNALKRNSPHKDQWMRMPVFCKRLSQCLFHKSACVFEDYLSDCKRFHTFHTQT